MCDDGSEKDLSAIQTAFSMLFERFVWIRNDVSLGAAASRNKLIALSTGNYVTGLDDDDEFTPDRIETFIFQLQQHNYSFLCSRYLKHDGRVWEQDKKPEGVIDYISMLNSNEVGNQIFIKRDSLIAVGGFDEEAPSMMDYDLWLRLIQRFGSAYRINSLTYKLYQNPKLSRITNSNDITQGLNYFINKHKNKLSSKMNQNIIINDAINRHRKLSLKELLSATRFGNLFFILVYLSSRFKLFKRSIQI